MNHGFKSAGMAANLGGDMAHSGTMPGSKGKWGAIRSRIVGSESGGVSLSVWAFRFLLWYICVLLVQPQNRYTFLWPLHIANLTFISALVLHVMDCVRSRRPFFANNLATWLGLLMIGLTFVSNTNGYFQNGWGGWNPYIDTYVKSFLLLILVATMCTSVERVWVVQMTVLMSTLWWLKSGLRLSAAGATYSEDRLMGAAIGLIENPNSFAYMLCIMLPLYLYALQHAKTKWMRWAFLACALSAVYIIFQTGSRTGLVTLLAVGIFFLKKYGRKNWKTIVLVALAITIIFPFSGEKNIRRFKTIPQSALAFLGLKENDKHEDYGRPLNQDEQSADERSAKNRDTWRLVKDYPLFGVGLVPQGPRLVEAGYGMAGLGQVHCEILMVGKQMGFVGMTLYYLILCVTCWAGHIALVKGRKLGWTAAGDMGRIFQIQAVAIAVGGFFCPMPWHPPMMIMVGSSIALSNTLGQMRSSTDL